MRKFLILGTAFRIIDIVLLCAQAQTEEDANAGRNGSFATITESDLHEPYKVKPITLESSDVRALWEAQPNYYMAHQQYSAPRTYEPIVTTIPIPRNNEGLLRGRKHGHTDEVDHIELEIDMVPQPQPQMMFSQQLPPYPPVQPLYTPPSPMMGTYGLENNPYVTTPLYGQAFGAGFGAGKAAAAHKHENRDSHHSRSFDIEREAAIAKIAAITAINEKDAQNYRIDEHIAKLLDKRRKSDEFQEDEIIILDDAESFEPSQYTKLKKSFDI